MRLVRLDLPDIVYFVTVVFLVTSFLLLRKRGILYTRIACPSVIAHERESMCSTPWPPNTCCLLVLIKPLTHLLEDTIPELSSFRQVLAI